MIVLNAKDFEVHFSIDFKQELAEDMQFIDSLVDYINLFFQEEPT